MRKLIISGVVLAVLLIGGAYAAIMAVSSSRLSKNEAPAVIGGIVKKQIGDMKTGPAGQDGMPCFAGLTDLNGDGVVDVEDCRGEKGDPGVPGTAASAATATAAAIAQASAKTTAPATPVVAAPAPVASAPATPPAAPPAPAKAKVKKAGGKAAVAAIEAANPPISFHQSVGVEINGVSVGEEDEEAATADEPVEDETKTPFVANEGTMVFAPVNIRVGGGRKGRQ